MIDEEPFPFPRRGAVMTVGLAQLGCGYWGPNLLRNLVQNRDCRVRWVVEPAAERRAFLAQQFPGIPVVEDYRRVLDDPAVQGVVIATPAASHARLALEALAAGKDILVEKPLATSVAEVDAIAAAADGRIVMAGHTFLYNNAVRHLKGLLDAGELGTVYYVAGQRLNLGQLRTDVDVWWNLAPHDIAILLYLFDGAMPARVAVEGLVYLQPGIPDVAFARLHWPDNRAAHLHLSWLDPGKSRRMTIVGSRRMVVYDDMADEKIRIIDKGIDFVPQLGQRWDFDEPPHLRPVHRFGDVLIPHVRMQEPLAVEIAHFIDCIRHRTPPLSGLDHARRVVAVLEAGTRARLAGRDVHLRELEGPHP